MSTIRLRSYNLPPQLQTWVSLDDLGRPLFWPSVWLHLHGCALATATAGRRLGGIGRLYRQGYEMTGKDCVDRLIAAGDLDELEPILQGLFSHLQNEAGRSKSDLSEDWEVAFAFVADFIERVSPLRGLRDLQIYKVKVARLKRLYGTLRLGRKPKRRAVRALPSIVVGELLELIDPNSPRNPFRSERQRWRNLCLVMLYVLQGLRRGEALLLPTNAIWNDRDPDTGERIYWINVVETSDEDDLPPEPRANPPSLKTVQSERQMPISADLVEIIEHFIVNFRGKHQYRDLFISNRGKPLSSNQVNDVFKVLSANLSDAARNALRNRLHAEEVSPRDLRHTAAVFRLAQFIEDGDKMAVALQKLRMFFGWAPDSKMALHYSRAYFHGRQQTVFGKQFDERVALIRTLSRLDGDLPDDSPGGEANEELQ